MARHIENEVEYYYDSHSTQEDLMGETAFHAALVRYLVGVLTWLFQGQLYAIYDNLNIYQTPNSDEYPLAPDVTVIQGVPYELLTRSWRVGKSGPPPLVAFEVASVETWTKDLREKPARYAEMGVQEYFAYDPHEVPLRASKNRRLFGWRLESNGRSMREIQPRSDGSLWSSSLDSWLVSDGTWLRLFDSAGRLRLTGEEFANQKIEIANQQMEIANQQTELAKQQAQFADQRANAAEEQAEIEAQRARAAIQQAQAFAEKLRSLGIDPDQISPDQLL